MPSTVTDFRNHPFDTNRVKAAARDMGSNVYPRLYAIENLFRVIVHSVLTVQIGTNWWTVAVNPALQKDVSKRMKIYPSQPWRSTPGKHEVYYVYLLELTKILTTNSRQFVPHIPDVANWTARLEEIRVPRNIVGHVNWLNDIDRRRIDAYLADVEKLVAKLATDPQLTFTVP